MDRLYAYFKETCKLSFDDSEGLVNYVMHPNPMTAVVESVSALMVLDPKLTRKEALYVVNNARHLLTKEDKALADKGSMTLSISLPKEAFANMKLDVSSSHESGTSSRQWDIFSGSSLQSKAKSFSLFQELGADALNSAVDESFPQPATAHVTECLWPSAQWKNALCRKNKKGHTFSAEANFDFLLGKQAKRPLPKTVNFLFKKARGYVVAPKRPDFYLLKKEAETATMETVAAILFTQSTSQKCNYSESVAVGEAIAVGEKFLRNASKNRIFIFVGLTSLRAIRWFKVFRLDDGFSSVRGIETANVASNLAGFMCSEHETLGVEVSSAVMVKGRFVSFDKFLGEGNTSIVHAVTINKKEYAVKVPRKGKDISADLENLTKLRGIKGVPVISLDYSTAATGVFMQPVCKRLDAHLVYSTDILNSLSDLVDILKSAHEKLMVNRDVRFENIMVANGKPFIVDWGYAVPLNEPFSYAGTTYYASDRVLELLEECSVSFPCEASDDLVSLVRSVSLHLGGNPVAYEQKLLALRKDDYSGIRRFWKKYLSGEAREFFLKLQNLASKSRYSELKEGIHALVSSA